MRDIADKISKFFKSIHHYELGLLVLGEMVQTISERQKGHAMTEHRRCAVSFRDKSLFRLFQYGITGLRKAITPGLRNADRVTYSALELCQRVRPHASVQIHPCLVCYLVCYVGGEGLPP